MNSAAAIAIRTLDTVAIKDIGDKVAVNDGAIAGVGDLSFGPSSERASVTVSFPVRAKNGLICLHLEHP
jgi:hypothetical protein